MREPANRSNPDSSDESLLRVSLATWYGLKILVGDGNWGMHLIPAMGILASHSLETALKAYLLQKGWPAKTVIDFRHDLTKLWKTARTEGLELKEPMPEWASTLAYYHKPPHRYRYPEHRYAAGISKPELIVKELKALIDNLIRRSEHIF